MWLKFLVGLGRARTRNRSSNSQIPALIICLCQVEFCHLMQPKNGKMNVYYSINSKLKHWIYTVNSLISTQTHFSQSVPCRSKKQWYGLIMRVLVPQSGSLSSVCGPCWKHSLNWRTAVPARFLRPSLRAGHNVAALLHTNTEFLTSMVGDKQSSEKRLCRWEDSCRGSERTSSLLGRS